MRVFIVSDMEGVAGITNWPGVTGGDPLYDEGRKLYTEEINAAARGAFDAGATEVVVMDCHGAGGGWSFNSLIAEQLDRRVEFVVQHEWTEYTGALEDGCDAALFVGMHAMAGTPGRADEPHRLRHRLAQRHASTASKSARPASTPRCAATGAARWCSSPATRPPAVRAQPCSAPVSRRCR